MVTVAKPKGDGSFTLTGPAWILVGVLGLGGLGGFASIASNPHEAIFKKIDDSMARYEQTLEQHEKHSLDERRALEQRVTQGVTDCRVNGALELQRVYEAIKRLDGRIDNLLQPRPPRGGMTFTPRPRPPIKTSVTEIHP